jgi:ribosomal-protein-alanine N-acetyltransferase
VEADGRALSSLLGRSTWKHQHLDWFSALDLLGRSPFYLAFRKDHLAGCLACPPDIAEVAWIRLFVVEPGVAVEKVWDALWRVAHGAARAAGAQVAAALPSTEWMPAVLEGGGFHKVNDVIFLERDGAAPPSHPLSGVMLRPFLAQDVPAVAGVDHGAFHPLWQLSEGSLASALSQSLLATVAERDGLIVGYQITTSSAKGAHLARLAVDPAHQRAGIGTLLVTDALHALRRRGVGRVSVNTQSDNQPSQRLYAHLGFAPSDQALPVYSQPLGA